MDLKNVGSENVDKKDQKVQRQAVMNMIINLQVS
jgi:hypothetical protein